MAEGRCSGADRASVNAGTLIEKAGPRDQDDVRASRATTENHHADNRVSGRGVDGDLRHRITVLSGRITMNERSLICRPLAVVVVGRGAATATQPGDAAGVLIGGQSSGLRN